jgi:hypothetical protein
MEMSSQFHTLAAFTQREGVTGTQWVRDQVAPKLFWMSLLKCKSCPVLQLSNPWPITLTNKITQHKEDYIAQICVSVYVWMDYRSNNHQDI